MSSRTPLPGVEQPGVSRSRAIEVRAGTSGLWPSSPSSPANAGVKSRWGRGTLQVLSSHDWPGCGAGFLLF